MGPQKSLLNVLLIFLGLWQGLSITEAKPATSEISQGYQVFEVAEEPKDQDDVRILRDETEHYQNSMLTDEDEEDGYPEMDAGDTVESPLQVANAEEQAKNFDKGRTFDLSESNSGSTDIRSSLSNIDRERNCRRGRDGNCIRRTSSEERGRGSRRSSSEESNSRRSRSDDSNSRRSRSDDSNSRRSRSDESRRSRSDESRFSNSDENSRSRSNESRGSRRRRGFCGLNPRVTRGWGRFLRRASARLPRPLRPFLSQFLDIAFLDRACNLVREFFLRRNGLSGFNGLNGL